MNLGFGRRSELMARLLEAERRTGYMRGRIARSVLEDYLEIWIEARLAERARIERALRALKRSASTRSRPRKVLQ